MFTKKVQIHDISRWGSYEKWFAISGSGDLIAVRTIDKGSPWDGSKNVFFYNSQGQLLHTMGNCHGGERGIAFWPDNHHILLPGCDPENGSRDGIKHYRIGDPIEIYELPFDSTISGIWCQIIGASPSGRYVLISKGPQSGGYCIDTVNNRHRIIPKITTTQSVYYEPIFSPDERYVALRGRRNFSDCTILSLPECDVIWRTEQGFLCFSEQPNEFLALEASDEGDYRIIAFDLEEIEWIAAITPGLQNLASDFNEWTFKRSLRSAQKEISLSQFAFPYREAPTHACISQDGVLIIFRCRNKEVIQLAPDGNRQTFGMTDEIVRDIRFAGNNDNLVIMQEHSVLIWKR